MRRVIPLVVVALCGCDDTTATDAGAMMTADAGGADGGAADAGATGTPFTWSVLLRDSSGVSGVDGPPLVGARVIVETDVGTYEATTGADGVATVDAMSGDDTFDFLLLADGHQVGAGLDGRVADASEQGEFTLATWPPAEPVTVTVELTATGLPAAGSWCASASSWSSQCAVTSTLTLSAYEAQLQTQVVAAAIDAAGEVVEIAVVDLVDGDPVTAAVVFDGTSDSPITSRPITVQLPADPMSEFRNEDRLPLNWRGWLATVEAGTWLTRGFTSVMERSADGNSLTGTYFQFGAPGGELVHAIAAYPSFREGGRVRTFRYFEEEPTGELSFMDVPRALSEGDPIDGPIRWTSVEGAERYVLQVERDEGVPMWVVAETDGIVLPQLPADYDASHVFPEGEDFALFRLLAVRGTLPFEDDMASDPYAVDGGVASGPAFSLSR